MSDDYYYHPPNIGIGRGLFRPPTYEEIGAILGCEVIEAPSPVFMHYFKRPIPLPVRYEKDIDYKNATFDISDICTQVVMKRARVPFEFLYYHGVIANIFSIGYMLARENNEFKIIALKFDVNSDIISYCIIE